MGCKIIPSLIACEKHGSHSHNKHISEHDRTAHVKQFAKQYEIMKIMNKKKKQKKNSTLLPLKVQNSMWP